MVVAHALILTYLADLESSLRELLLCRGWKYHTVSRLLHSSIPYSIVPAKIYTTDSKRCGDEKLEKSVVGDCGAQRATSLMTFDGGGCELYLVGSAGSSSLRGPRDFARKYIPVGRETFP